MIWITDGHVDKYIDNSESIPAGWRKGRSGIAGEKSGKLNVIEYMNIMENYIHKLNYQSCWDIP